MRLIKIFLFTVFFLLQNTFTHAQKILIADTSGKIITRKNIGKINDSAAKKYNPGTAIRRSAILPGWGQYTNKKYWKIPVVYGALGTSAYFFFRNFIQYKDAKFAYTIASDTDPTNDILIKEPYFTVRYQPDRIRVFRNQVRQNVDYSALFFILFWGLNVADAAVDAHLKTFDVSDDLSLQIKTGHSNMANTNGLSLVLNIGK